MMFGTQVYVPNPRVLLSLIAGNVGFRNAPNAFVPYIGLLQAPHAR